MTSGEVAVEVLQTGAVKLTGFTGGLSNAEFPIRVLSESLEAFIPNQDTARLRDYFFNVSNCKRANVGIT